VRYLFPAKTGQVRAAPSPVTYGRGQEIPREPTTDLLLSPLAHGSVIPLRQQPSITHHYVPDYGAASLPVVTSRVKVPTMGDFPFAHLA
jgi:hypothetical protein